MRVLSLLSLLPVVALATSVPRHLLRRDLSTTYPTSDWTYNGCYVDDVGNRLLNGAQYADASGMTQQSCVAFCTSKGFRYAGVEWSQECFCGDKANSAWTLAPATECNYPCSGDASEACGGSSRLTVFSSNAKGPSENPGGNGWVSKGCYSDSTSARTLAQRVYVAGDMTVALCTAACASKGYRLAGVEYSTECYCDSQLRNGGAAVSSGCSMTCAGDSSSYCGGPNRLNLYELSGAATPTPGPIPSGWSALSDNCYTDNTGARTLPNRVGTDGDITIAKCLNACRAANYVLAGVEYGSECWCGNTFANFGGPANDGQAQCNMACAGNNAEICGGPNRLNVFRYATASSTTTAAATTTTTATATTTTTPACSAAPGNYGFVQNGGFENGISPWTTIKSSGSWDISITNKFVSRGCSALLFSHPQGNSGSATLQQELKGLTLGNSYTFKANVGRPSNNPGTPTGSTIVSVNLGGIKIYSQPMCNEPGCVTYIESPFTYNPQVLQTLQLTFDDSQSSSSIFSWPFWVDEVSLTSR